MAKIKFRRGNQSGIPILAEGEPAFCLDTKKLFIGDGSSNYEIGSSGTGDVYTVIRSAPTNLNDYVEIGYISGASVLGAITITGSGGNLIGSKRYLLCSYSGTTTGWSEVLPILSSQVSNANDFALDANWDNNNTKLELRVRLSQYGAVVSTSLNIQVEIFSGSSFVQTTSTGTASAPGVFYDTSIITQVDDKVGIGIYSPTEMLDVNGNVKSQRLLTNQVLTNSTLPSSNTTGLTIHYDNTSSFSFATKVHFQQRTTSDRAFQLAAEDSANKLWFRTGIDTGWQPWVQIWHEGNDGSGSGLDADKLDGHEATDFSLDGHVHPNATQSTSGFMSSGDKTKLDDIEPNATADMTPSEILTAIKTVDGENSGLDADLIDGKNVDDSDNTTSSLWTANKIISEIDSKVNGVSWQEPVIDKDLTTPPASPATGDRYIVASGGTGDWSGHDYDIAEWDGSAWQFIVDVEGLAVYVEDEDRLYTHNGSQWVTFGSIMNHNSLTTLQGGDGSNQFYHLTELEHDTIVGTKTAGNVYAAPATANGVPTFRSLVASDLPSDAYDSRYVNITGDTMTGDLTINKNDPRLFISGPNQDYRIIMFETNGSHRWYMGADSENESGSNAGSNFVLNRYDDSQSSLGYIFKISRDSGEVQFYNSIRTNKSLYIGSDGQGDSGIHFYDDNSNDWRSLRWVDSSNDWRIEDNSGVSQKLWHGGNDGSGSGLDADLLDGHEASYFATSSHNHDSRYVNVTGDTMSGNLNFNTTEHGVTWSMNTDSAYIKFFNTGDGDTNSRLEYATGDNGNEFHRWLVDGVEVMTAKQSGITVGTTSNAYNTSLKVLTDNTHIASIEAYGSTQGTGKVYVGQSSSFGGGIIYNGDDNPDIPQTSDAVSFYRKSNNTEYEVFYYTHSSNNVYFHGDISASHVTARNYLMINEWKIEQDSDDDSLNYIFTG